MVNVKYPFGVAGSAPAPPAAGAVVVVATLLNVIAPEIVTVLALILSGIYVNDVRLYACKYP